MTALRTQIDNLEAALKRLRNGDFQAFNQLPIMLDDLRKGAVDLEQRQEELVSLYEVGQEIISDLSMRIDSDIGVNCGPIAKLRKLSNYHVGADRAV